MPVWWHMNPGFSFSPDSTLSDCRPCQNAFVSTPHRAQRRAGGIVLIPVGFHAKGTMS